MIDSRLIKRVSQEVGSGPAISWYLERMQLQETIDRCVPAHRNRTELSHGQAVVGLVTMILNHSHALYHMEEWAKTSHILSQVLPGIPAAAYTDDRLGDTLDALFAAGLDGVQSQVSWAICQAFQLPVEAIHCDTTTVSFFGAYAEGEVLAGPNASGVPVVPRITYGHSKQHRPDLKQLLLSLSVNEDQLPLFGTVLDGNTADAHTYLKQWLAMSQMLRRSDFLFLGDSKLASRKNLRAIIDREGVFLSAATLTPKLKKELQKKAAKGALTWRPFPTIPGQVSAEDVQGYTYVKRLIKIGSGRKYRIRQLIIRSEALARRHAATRQKHSSAFQQCLQTLNGKLNQYQLKTQEQIENALDKLRRRYPQAAALVRVRLTYTTEVRKRLCGPGRAGKNRKYRTTTRRRYRLECQPDKAARARAQRLDGIFVRVTNATEERLPDSLALVTYKDQWKVERQNRLLKGPIALTPAPPISGWAGRRRGARPRPSRRSTRPRPTRRVSILRGYPSVR